MSVPPRATPEIVEFARLAFVIAVPFHTPAVIVPTEVKEEDTTLLAKVVPVKVPAGAITAFVDAAVINPFAFTVKLGIAVAEPKEPTFAFTVASVAAIAVAPEPVTSPDKVIVWLLVR